MSHRFYLFSPLTVMAESVSTFGRKKSATAVAYCKRGNGLIKVNGCPLTLVEPNILRYKVCRSLLCVCVQAPLLATRDCAPPATEVAIPGSKQSIFADSSFPVPVCHFSYRCTSRFCSSAGRRSPTWTSASASRVAVTLPRSTPSARPSPRPSLPSTRSVRRPPRWRSCCFLGGFFGFGSCLVLFCRYFYWVCPHLPCNDAANLKFEINRVPLALVLTTFQLLSILSIHTHDFSSSLPSLPPYPFLTHPHPSQHPTPHTNRRRRGVEARD